MNLWLKASLVLLLSSIGIAAQNSREKLQIDSLKQQLKTATQDKPAQALEMYELNIQMRDSLSNEETCKASLKIQFQYEFDKKEAV